MASFNFLRVLLSHFFRNLRYTLGSQVLALLTVSLSLLAFTFFYLIYSNAMSVGVRLNDEIKIVIYLDLDSNPTAAQRERLEDKIRSFGDVERVVFVTKEEAYTDLQSRLGSRTAVLEGLPVDFLPPSVEVYPSKELRSLSTLDTFVRHLYDQPMTMRVQYGQQWVDRFQQVMFIIRTVTILSGALLVVSLTYTVAYTIQLVMSSRREELQYLSLIGASPALIQLPFVIEGLFQGLVGGLASLAALYGVYTWSLRSFSENSFISQSAVSFLSSNEIAVLIVASMLFCSSVSFFSVRRYMRTDSQISRWSVKKLKAA